MLRKLGLTAALAASSVLHSKALAAALVPNLAPRADGMDSWVTVRPDGVVRTIEPDVTSIGGSTRTISPAPTAWTTVKDGKVVTISGQAPAPTADSESGAGSFVLCDKTIGEFAPFCTPEDGSVLIVGRTYYSTYISLPIHNLGGVVGDCNVLIRASSYLGSGLLFQLQRRHRHRGLLPR